MSIEFSYVTGVGLLGALILLIASIREGRVKPHHQVLWIIGIVALSVSIIFRLAIFIGTSIQGFPLGSLPIAIGNIAVILVLVSVFWQPLWAGWFLIGSAIVIPLLSVLFELVVLGVTLENLVTPVMLISYSLPALITGTLFVISMRQPAIVEQPMKTAV